MKRGKPLERRSGLSQDPAKARAWQQRSAERAQANARERGRKPLARAASLDHARTDRGVPYRRSTLKPKATPEEPGKAEAVKRWRKAVLGSVDSTLDPHHTVPRQVLVRIARSRRLHGPDYWAVVLDPRVGVPLTRAQHEAHTVRSRQIAREHLPHRCLPHILAAIKDYGPEAAAAFEREHPPLAVLRADGRAS